MIDDDQVLTPSEAGMLCNPPLTAAAIRTHDDELQPLFTAKGRRIYLRSRVEAFARQWAAKRATKTAKTTP